jgi:aspartate-semialdehyde dehydrogenase
MDIEEAFDKLWQYGSELMASMCNGDIKIFAKWFYDAGYKAGAEAMKAENARLKETIKNLKSNITKLKGPEIAYEIAGLQVENARLKELVREGCMNVDALNNTRPDINLPNYLMALSKLLKWAQKAKKAIKVAEGE